eukprot:1057601-Karenia_brevis.AAC.1
MLCFEALRAMVPPIGGIHCQSSHQMCFMLSLRIWECEPLRDVLWFDGALDHRTSERTGSRGDAPGMMSLLLGVMMESCARCSCS